MVGAQPSRLSFMTAGQGSAFLPYGQGIATVLTAAGVTQIDIKESKGSNENLSAVNASPTTLGCAFLAEQLDPRLRRASQIESLYGKPVVATLGRAR